jgi:hypothetical protein
VQKNDGHDTGAAYADSWLQGFLEPKLSNANFITRTAVVVIFDENSGTTPKPGRTSKSCKYSVRCGPGSGCFAGGLWDKVNDLMVMTNFSPMMISMALDFYSTMLPGHLRVRVHLVRQTVAPYFLSDYYAEKPRTPLSGLDLLRGDGSQAREPVVVARP